MTDAAATWWLRRFLLWTAAAVYGGAVVELVLTEHYESTLQLVPFGLCTLGFAAILVAIWRPQRPALLALRWVGGVVAAGSLLGIYEHLMGNWAFAHEVAPGRPTDALVWAALNGGNPLLAPGMILLAALLAAAATYGHPALQPSEHPG